MDLEGLSDEMQSLVIASTLDRVNEKERDLIVVVPEAWKFAPEGRGNPVKREAEKLIRQGASIRLFLWFDSQDLAGVDKALLKQVDNWILGRQREINEVLHTLDQVPIPRKQRPKPEEVMQLPIGHFFACFDDEVRKVYVRPSWLSEGDAIKVAMGAKPVPRPLRERRRPEIDMDVKERTRYEDEIERLKKDNWTLTQEVSRLAAKMEQEKIERERRKKSISGLPGDDVPLLRPRAVGSEAGSTPAATPEPRFAGAATSAVQLGPINLEAVERTVTISHSEELREFQSINPKGRIVYVLLKDLENRPSTEMELADAMRERGWNYGHGTLAPELSKLVGNGDLVKSGERPAQYRIPGKLKIELKE